MLGGSRDVLGRLRETSAARCVGIDIALDVCAAALATVAGLRAVQADIRALPFRPGCFDAVLDLSTLDHISEFDIAAALGEYGRVLGARGALLVVFWQRNPGMRLRLALKGWLRRPEKTGQYYISRRAVKAALSDELVVREVFVVGSLLVAPQPVVGFLLHRLSPVLAARVVRWIAAAEAHRSLHPLLRHVAGLYGLVARRRTGAAEGTVDRS